jgi:tRNA threonylcarbamoyladenosine biosynthesis protein TsaE
MHSRSPVVNTRTFLCRTPEDTFEIGRRVGSNLKGGEMVLLMGGLGAGKTLLTKGILEAAGFDVDEVTSPSFALVNLYHTEPFDVYHIDLWRLEPGPGAVHAVGLDEILEDESAVVIIEWAERLGDFRFDRDVVCVRIEGDGEDPREIAVDSTLALDTRLTV